MTDYLQKFRLDKKTAFIVGGLGLIGSEVSSAFAMAGANTIVLDLNHSKSRIFHEKMHERGFDIIIKSFNCADMENLDNNFSALIEENGCPDIFINCSYPRTEDWGSSSF